MGDIFREVDEELRHERLERLWKRYGVYVIVLAVLIVAGVAGWKYWSSQQRAKQYAEGEKFYSAELLLKQGKVKDAEKAFSAIADEASSGYGILAKLNEASILIDAKNPTAAIKVYDGVAADDSAPASLRNLATILGGLQALKVASIDRATIESRLQPLTVAGNAYRFIATEVLAAAALRAGDTAKAVERYKSIVDDADAPVGIRGRASRMVKILGAS